MVENMLAFIVKQRKLGTKNYQIYCEAKNKWPGAHWRTKRRSSQFVKAPSRNFLISVGLLYESIHIYWVWCLFDSTYQCDIYFLCTGQYFWDISYGTPAELTIM